MRKMMYFAVNEGGTFEGQLEGVNCRFREGRVYEIDPRNKQLCAAIQEKCEAGAFSALKREEGMSRLEAQEATDRARKQERLAARAAAQGVSIEALAPEATATVEAGSQQGAGS